MKEPMVSIIIPVYNTGPILLETIDSIKETLPYEIIIVDDGSKDTETLKVLEGLNNKGNIR